MTRRIKQRMPTLQPLVAGGWRLAAPWSCELVESRGTLYVDAGFVTDGASIPRIAWSIVGHPLAEDYVVSALAHDALYTAELLPREACDSEFRAQLKLAGVNLLRRNEFYWAVRLGGGIVWGGHTKQGVAAARLMARIR